MERIRSGAEAVRLTLSLSLVGLFLPMMAQAQTMVATRPGLMCTSAGALATLTLPDGSNRGAGPHAHADDDATKQMGGCIDIPPDARVAVHQRRINTSIVSYNPGDGDRVFTVPNIDFSVQHDTASVPADAPPGDPITAFFSALGRDCPGLGWEHADMRAYGAPLEEAAKSLSASQHAELTSAVASNCQEDSGLECGNTVAIDHIVQAGQLDALAHAFCTAAPGVAAAIRY